MPGPGAGYQIGRDQSVAYSGGMAPTQNHSASATTRARTTLAFPLDVMGNSRTPPPRIGKRGETRGRRPSHPAAHSHRRNRTANVILRDGHATRLNRV